MLSADYKLFIWYAGWTWSFNVAAQVAYLAQHAQRKPSAAGTAATAALSAHLAARLAAAAAAQPADVCPEAADQCLPGAQSASRR